MGCGCGGKKFTGSAVTGARTASPGQRLASPSAPSGAIIQATGVKLGTAPAIQPMQRKTV
jgi:hypothetical protein